MKLPLPLFVLWASLAACGDARDPAQTGSDAGRAEPSVDASYSPRDASRDRDAGDGGPVVSARDAGVTPFDAAAAPEDAGQDGSPEDAGLDAGDGSPRVAAPKCETTAPTSCDDPPTTYADIDPVLEEYCRSCHYGEFGGPWPLNSYEHVAAWQEDIRSAMLDCSMPPKDAGIAMPTEDRQLLLRWVRCGAPM